MPKTTAIVIAPKNFQEEELQVIRDLLRWYGIRTLVVAKTRGLAVGSRGTELEPDLAIGELAAQPVDALVFVDGEGVTEYSDDPAVYRAIHQAQLGRKILAAINDAPLVLANAGALIGRTVTAAPAHEQLLRSRGARYTGMPLEVDQQIITAQAGMADAFANRIAYLLGA